MLTLLRKVFIKDYKNIDNPKVRDKHGKLASIVGIITNILLAAGKATIGFITGSIAIIADALNNLSDSASSVISLVGFHIAGKPADKKHPFGHERFEYVSSLMIAIVMAALAVELLVTSFKNIFNPEPTDFNLVSFIVLGVAIVVKLWQGLFYRRCAKLIDSVSLKASGQDSINDVITTSVVLIGAIISYYVKFNLDGYLGVVVSLFILWSSIGLIRESISPLLGEPISKKELDEITADIMAYPGVLGVHDGICHIYGANKRFMSIHVEIDCDNDLNTAHELIDGIEHELSLKHKLILTIHMDPINRHFERYDEIKDKVSSIISEISSELSFHDFRLVQGGNRVNVIFDVVVPFGFKYTNQEIENIIVTKMNEFGSYACVIEFDRVYAE